MRRIHAAFVAAVLMMGLIYNGAWLAGFLYNNSEVITDQSFDQLRHFTLEDGIPVVEEYYRHGAAEPPTHQLLEVHASDDPDYECMARSPYYKIYFKDAKARMIVQNTWVEFELVNQELGEIQRTEHVINENTLSVSDVFNSASISYELGSFLVKETMTLEESKPFERIIQEISWNGVNPLFQEDGSILFVDENGKEVLEILPPFMEDATGSACTDVHYELVKAERGFELHKIIDEKGLEWLQEAVYPVVIDPSMQTFEDAWESSGFHPYGQYFKNLDEYVNPVNGQLTITNTDLVIPGRGLDLVISRIYETMAVFYQAEPYGYTPPSVNVGKGWTLNFPYIGDEYFYFWGGTAYKMEWVGSTFENHTGVHFILVKNSDNTYTLTMANGNTCEFNTAGKLTQYKDMDLNTITFIYTSGALTSITDTIGRTVTFTYSNGHLWKITYNGAELEYGYNGDGNLIWIEDFLNRRTSFYYSSGWYEWAQFPSGYAQKYNVYLLSKIVYPTGGYTTYTYDRFSYEDIYGDDGTCLDYFKYFATDQRVYETNQVRHSGYTYVGNFIQIISCTKTVKNQSDTPQGSYQMSVNSSQLICQKIIRNASGTELRKVVYVYNSKKELIQEDVYNDGATLSYSSSYTYDTWGNTIYYKNAEGHEKFFSYANTSTSGYFVDNTGTVVRQFSNVFSFAPVPPSVHTVLLGMAEKQDNTFVREVYTTYDSEAHPVQTKNAFGESTAWLTFSGTFNENTGSISFPIDLTGHTVTGNAVLQIAGLPSDDTYQESLSYGCPCNPTIKCTWTSGSWSGRYYSVHWAYCKPGFPLECDDGWASIGPFTHYPGTLGYLSYTTNPPLGGKSNTFSVTTNWKAYPVQVQYAIDESSWEPITNNLQNSTITIPVNITGGSHTLNFAESSSKGTKFSWYLYVPVDSALDTHTTTITYDTYGNVTSITDAESNTISFTYSSAYSQAYLTEISTAVGQDTITKKATYDLYRGWITSIQEPKGVDAGSGYDYLYTYDLLGRITKVEFPLLSQQSQRSCVEAVYDDVNRKVTLVDQLRHFTVQHYDKLGRLTDVKLYTGTYESGVLYTTVSYTYRYDSLLSTVIDAGNDTYTYTCDFLGRITQISYPDLSSISCSYDDTSNKIILTDGRGYRRIHWFDWLLQLAKTEEEYATDTFAVTTYQYDEVGHLISFTDAGNRTTSYEYASPFGLTTIHYPDSTYEEYEYDNMGNITSFTDADENETLLTYDSVYRLTQVQYPDLSTVSFSYDLNGNRIQMDDNAPNTGDYVEYTYDYWNQLNSKTRHISQNTYTFSYQYDEARRVTTLIYPDSMQVVYSYDDLNRVTEVKRYVDGLNDEVLMSNLQYDIEGLLTQVDYGNSLQATFSYDSRDRISTIDVKDGGTSFLDMDYTYDCNSNIIQLINGWRDTESTWHSETESYNYDGLNRLTSANSTSWSHAYSYDEMGNMVAKDGVTYTINSANQVTASSDGTSFIYDACGNRTQKTKGNDTWEYIYDYANRLKRVEKNDTPIGEYIYNGDGKRIQATENSVTTICLYSGSDALYEETVTGSATYIYGPTGRIAKRTTINQETNTFYYHKDHLGSTRLITDADRNIVSTVAYQPYGETYSEEGSEDYLFNGKERDATGLYYYGARYYDPEIGRFITGDSSLGRLRNPQSLNKYIYCLNNPLKFIDLFGLEEGDYKTKDRKDWTEEDWEDYYNDLLQQGMSPEDIVNDLIEEGDYLGSVICTLFWLGYDSSDITGMEYDSGLGKIYLNIQDTEVVIHVENCYYENGSSNTTPGDMGDPPENEGDTINIHIYAPAFSKGAGKLYNVVGHEMQHAHHYAKGGLYWGWYNYYKSKKRTDEEAKKAALRISEMLAWRWSVTHFSDAPFEGGFYEAMSMWQQYSESVYSIFNVFGSP